MIIHNLEKVDWENYRRADGSIDLKAVILGGLTQSNRLMLDESLKSFITMYCESIEAFSFIKSRQAAAVAIMGCIFALSQVVSAVNPDADMSCYSVGQVALVDGGDMLVFDGFKWRRKSW
jgi:hypothetical protein